MADTDTNTPPPTPPSAQESWSDTAGYGIGAILALALFILIPYWLYRLFFLANAHLAFGLEGQTEDAILSSGDLLMCWLRSNCLLIFNLTLGTTAVAVGYRRYRGVATVWMVVNVVFTWVFNTFAIFGWDLSPEPTRAAQLDGLCRWSSIMLSIGLFFSSMPFAAAFGAFESPQAKQARIAAEAQAGTSPPQEAATNGVASQVLVGVLINVIGGVLLALLLALLGLKQ